MTYATSLGINAKKAKKAITTASTIQKNNALAEIADALINNSSYIISQNRIDLENAVSNDISVTMQDRLMLNEARIKAIASSLQEVIALDDPVGYIEKGYYRPNGLRICKTRVPLGVIGIIFESRPNVTVDAAALCLKSGNAVILRGGKEAFNSNKALVNVMRGAVEQVGFPADIIQLVEDTSREVATQIMQLDEYLDVLIPRGGAGLISTVKKNSTVPVIETGVGNCHVYVDSDADVEMAAKIVDNAKTSRPSVCNAIENLIIHKDISIKALLRIKELLDKHNVEIRGCEKTKAILGDSIKIATEEDYATEFLDYIIAVKVVDTIDEAIDHITKYSSMHSESIITNSLINAERFQKEVDAAAVYVNASTRFTDGGEFGLGAEIGISTQKLHSRGPMGLTDLTTVKYLINGNGQIR